MPDCIQVDSLWVTTPERYSLRVMSDIFQEEKQRVLRIREVGKTDKLQTVFFCISTNYFGSTLFGWSWLEVNGASWCCGSGQWYFGTSVMIVFILGWFRLSLVHSIRLFILQGCLGSGLLENGLENCVWESASGLIGCTTLKLVR